MASDATCFTVSMASLIIHIMFICDREMDMFTTQRTRSKSPPVKNSFQRELEAKMKERKQRGLSADLSDSAHGSDDELGSDNGSTFTQVWLSAIVVSQYACNFMQC